MALSFGSITLKDADWSISFNCSIRSSLARVTPLDQISGELDCLSSSKSCLRVSLSIVMTKATTVSGEFIKLLGECNRNSTGHLIISAR